MLRNRDKGFAYGAALFAAILMGLMGIIVRNMSADVRLNLDFVFLLGYLVITGTTVYESMWLIPIIRSNTVSWSVGE